MRYSDDLSKLKKLFEDVKERDDYVTDDQYRGPATEETDVIDDFDVDISGADNYITTSNLLEGSVEDDTPKKKEDDEDDMDVDITSADKYIAPKAGTEVAFKEDEEKYSDLVSSLVGATQGSTLGFGEELGAGILALTGAEAGYEKLMDLFNPENARMRKEAKEAMEKIGADDPMTGPLDRYKILRDTARRDIEARREEDPYSFGTGEVLGGVATGLATGPGAAVTGAVRSTVAKEGAKAVGKNLAKAGGIGAVEGGVAGVGYSEGENVDRLLEDAKTGAQYGALFSLGTPVAGKILATAGKFGAKAVNKTLESVVPGWRSTVKPAYQYGRQGKKIDGDQIIADMDKNAEEMIQNLEQAFKNNDTKKLKELLDVQGHEGVDIADLTNQAIAELEKIKAGDSRKIFNKDLLPYLKEDLLGEVDDVLEERASKMSLKKQIESRNRGVEADIKAEKKITKDALENNLGVEGTDELYGVTDDLDNAITSKGEIVGKEATFEAPDGSTFTKRYTSDATEFQPEIEKFTEDGRKVITVTDKGSGKKTAFVGELEDMSRELDDLKNLTLARAEEIRSYINNITDVESLSGESDPVKKVGLKLAGDIKKKIDEVIESAGNVELLDKSKKIKDIMGAKELVGLNKKLARAADVRDVFVTEKLSDQLAFPQKLSKQARIDKAMNKIGDEIYTPKLRKSYELLREINVIAGNEGYDNVTRAGGLKLAFASVPNALGRASKGIHDVAYKVKGTNIGKNILEFPLPVLDAIRKRLASKDNKAYKAIANQLNAVLSADSNRQAALLHMLVKQTAVKEAIQDTVKDMVEEVEIPEDAMFTPERQEESNSMYASAIMPDNYGNEAPQDDISRGPASGMGRVRRDIERNMNKEILVDEARTQGLTDNQIKEMLNQVNFEGTLRNEPESAYYRPSTIRSKFPRTIREKGLTNEDISSMSLISDEGVKLYKNMTADQIEERQKKLFDTFYGDKLGNEGEGYAHRGQGFLQLTGKVNQDKYAKDMDLSDVRDSAKASVAYFKDKIKRLRDNATTDDYTKMVVGEPNSDELEKRRNDVNKINLPSERIEYDNTDKVDGIKKDAERIMIQKGSGGQIPLSQLENLMAKVDDLRISQDQKDIINKKAVKMESPRDLKDLQGLLNRLKGIS